MRSTPAGSRVLALVLSVAAAAGVSAHRLDELLQAARIAVDPDRVTIDLDLTPGVAVADAFLAGIDRDGDGSLTATEQQAYAAAVLGALELAIDGQPLPLGPGPSGFPAIEAVRRGEGTIRLRAVASVPPQAAGVHRLSFRNRHHPEQSVYLANALVPESDRVAIAAQRRDGDQRELTIEYSIRPPAAAIAPRIRLLAASVVLSGLLVWGASRARRRRSAALDRGNALKE